MNGLVKVSSVAEVLNGKTPAKSEHRGVGHPVLKIRDVDEFGRFRGAFESFVDSSFAAKHSGRHVKVGDTLILNAAHNASYVGSKTHLANSETAGALTTGEWLIIRCNSQRVDPAFMNYWIRSPRAREAIKFIVKGIHLYPKDVAELTMPLPSLAEQRQLVDILSRAECIVRLRREAHQKAAELVPAIYVTMFGDPTSNPKGWPVKTLIELTKFQSGGTPSKSREDLWMGTLPWVSPKDMKVVEISDSIDHVSDAVLRETNLKLVPVGSLLIVVRGMILVHTVPVAQTSVPVVINQDMKALIPNSAVDSSYLLWALKVQHARILALVDTAAHGTKKLDTSKIEALEIPVPPIEMQRLFKRRADDVVSIVCQQAAATVKAKATFDALLSRAFSSGR